MYKQTRVIMKCYENPYITCMIAHISLNSVSEEYLIIKIIWWLVFNNYYGKQKSVACNKLVQKVSKNSCKCYYCD